MPVIVNPNTRTVRVVVDGGYIVLKMNNPTNEQILKYQKNRFKTGVHRNKQTFENNAVDLKIQFCDDLLIDVSARDMDGNPDQLLYITSSGETAELNSQVENWKGHIKASVKIAAMGFLDQEEAESDETIIKN